MKKINDTQNNAIFEAISDKHIVLCRMYEEIDLIKKKHKEELDNFVKKIKTQETKVQELCEGKIKFYMNSDNFLELDLTD